MVLAEGRIRFGDKLVIHFFFKKNDELSLLENIEQNVGEQPVEILEHIIK